MTSRGWTTQDDEPHAALPCRPTTPWCGWPGTGQRGSLRHPPCWRCAIGCAVAPSGARTRYVIAEALGRRAAGARHRHGRGRRWIPADRVVGGGGYCPAGRHRAAGPGMRVDGHVRHYGAVAMPSARGRTRRTGNRLITRPRRGHRGDDRSGGPADQDDRATAPWTARLARRLRERSVARFRPTTPCCSRPRRCC